MNWRGMVIGALAMLALPAAPRAELRAPQNVNVEPTTQKAEALTTRAAVAGMNQKPEEARDLADQAIRADPNDPWPYYDKGMALAQLGQTDAALAALRQAEERFVPADRWGRSVAIYGRAHTLDQSGRCTEARGAYEEYATFVGKDDPEGARMAREYGSDCRSPAMPAQARPTPNR